MSYLLFITINSPKRQGMHFSMLQVLRQVAAAAEIFLPLMDRAFAVSRIQNTVLSKAGGRI